MLKRQYKKRILLAGLFLSSYLIYNIGSIPAFASSHLDEAEARKSLRVETNEIENWPDGPLIGAESAILMEANTGVILYEKNIHEKLYPASTTKLLTSLLAVENGDLNDMVSFSTEAVYSVPWDGSNMGMDQGESMTLEDCLYGIMVLSANEVSNAVAEYVSGDIQTFVDLMNKRATELGCTDTHFANPHGYTNSDHYTSAYDLAMIGKAFFSNELLSKISRTKGYHWFPTSTQPDDMQLFSRNYFLNGSYTCDGLIGSKTGFTDESRQVLVTCAERNGIKLICVIMKEETPFQYEDTLALFDYGFDNFSLINVSQNETHYSVTDENFFHSDSDVFGNSGAILSLDKNSVVVIPKTTEFSNTNSSLEYKNDSDDIIAKITYDYNGKYVGEANLLLAKKDQPSFVFESEATEAVATPVPEINKDDNTTFIYVNQIIMWIIIIVVLFVLFLLAKRFFSSYYFARKRRNIMRRRRRQKSNYRPAELSRKSPPKRKSKPQIYDLK